MQEISYKDLKFNPFNLIGGEWLTGRIPGSCQTWGLSDSYYIQNS